MSGNADRQPGGAVVCLACSVGRFTMKDEEEQAWYWAGELAPTYDAPKKERHKEKERVEYRGDPLEDLPYQVILTGKPFNLSGVGYRIVRLLSSRPYHAFSTEEIITAANAVGDDQLAPVTEHNLKDHIFSLRRNLGFFADYVQSVPHIGYRFKP